MDKITFYLTYHPYLSDRLRCRNLLQFLHPKYKRKEGQRPANPSIVESIPTSNYNHYTLTEVGSKAVLIVGILQVTNSFISTVQDIYRCF